MSSLNPAARATAGANNAVDPVALEIAALKADADALRMLVASGDIVAAKVLPFNGLTDLIEILGKRVAASLPPTVRPGETLILEVTGFDGDHIVVRNLGVDQSAPTQAQAQAAAGNANAQAAAQEAAAPAASLVSDEVLSLGAQTLPAAPDPPSGGSQAASSGQAASDAQSVAAQNAPADPAPVPVRTVFGDASVQQAIRQAAQPTAPAPPTTPAGNPRVTIAVPSRAIETDQSIEARIIAARTTPGPALAAAAARTPSPLPMPAGPASAAAPAPLQVASQGTAPRPPAWIETAARSPAGAAAQMPANEAAPAPPPSSSSFTLPRTAQAYREPVVLLRSLHIPVTPTNVAAAKLALETPQRLPVALAALERALPLGNADPRVNTLRTLAAFVTNLDPESETFPAQLSAYVSNVLEGPEPKLAAVLQAFADAEAASLPAEPALAGEGASPNQAEAPAQTASAVQTASPAQPASPSASAAVPGGGTGTQVDVLVGSDTVAAAKIAERTTALDYDLKTVLQSFLAQPPPNASPASLAAAQNALAALTATQLNAAIAQQDPRALTITLPLPFMGSGDGAQIKISREKPESKEHLDADNFHIAFVLDTKNVGTVAVDLQTSGRAVNVAVKSETPRYAAAFKGMLDQLGDRLEKLRYNVVSLESEVVSRAAATVTSAAPGPKAQDDESAAGLDLRA